MKKGNCRSNLEFFEVQLLFYMLWKCGIWYTVWIRFHGQAAKLLLSHFSRVRLCDPIDGSPPGSPVPGFSRQEHYSGLPFPSPTQESEKWKWSRSVLSDSSRPHGLQPTRLLRPWGFPGKSTGVGCHRLLTDKGVWLKKKKTQID